MIQKHQLFSLDECVDFIKWIEKFKTFKPSKLSYQYTELDNTFPGYDKIKEWCDDNLNFTTNGWLQCFKYFHGNSFPLHRDRAETNYAKDSIINVNVVLNADYEGGEFFTEGIYYKNEPGLIYHYPSTQLHGVTEVSNGIRYVLLYTIRERDILKKPSSLL